MAEQNSKGIALVILGIVAIIAIVGLVLLFTGARKAATGEFYVPTAKEYGGAVRGLADPYSRAFVGRAYTGVGNPDKYGQHDIDNPYSGLGEGMQKVADVVYGETGTEKTVDSALSYNRNLAQIPSLQTSCNGLMYILSFELGHPEYAGEWVDLSAQQATGWQGEVIPVADVFQIAYQTPYYGLDDVLEPFKGMGHLYCGRWVGGGNNPAGTAI